jgi:hypothetical protein
MSASGRLVTVLLKRSDVRIKISIAKGTGAAWLALGWTSLTQNEDKRS